MDQPHYSQDNSGSDREGSPSDPKSAEYQAMTRMKVNALEVQLKSIEAAILKLSGQLAGPSASTTGPTLLRPEPAPPSPQGTPVSQGDSGGGESRGPPTPATAISSPLPSSLRRKPLPIGEPFSGDKTHFRAWQVTMLHKLEADAEFIGGARDQFAFIWANLSIPVQQEVASYYASGGYDAAWNPVLFMEYLAFCYHDVHGKERAQAKLDGLHQSKRESFSDFFPRFEQLLNQAGGSTWDDEQRLHKLRRALSPNLRQVALHRGVTRTNYAEAVKQYQSIAVDLETAAIEERNRTFSAAQTNSRTDGDGDIEMVGVAALGVGKGSSNAARTRQGIGARRNQSKAWIPEDLFKQRRERDLCTRCGGEGHYARDCVNAIVIRAVGAARASDARDGNDPEN
jgi:hypothetical protein